MVCSILFNHGGCRKIATLTGQKWWESYHFWPMSGEVPGCLRSTQAGPQDEEDMAHRWNWRHVHQQRADLLEWALDGPRQRAKKSIRDGCWTVEHHGLVENLRIQQMPQILKWYWIVTDSLSFAPSSETMNSQTHRVQQAAGHISGSTFQRLDEKIDMNPLWWDPPGFRFHFFQLIQFATSHGCDRNGWWHGFFRTSSTAMARRSWRATWPSRVASFHGRKILEGSHLEQKVLIFPL